jgi:Leucine-rich repeat (LRR) protein
VAIISITKPIQSAVLECDYTVGFCVPYNITPVTQPNEVITINGKPSDYVSTAETNFIIRNQVINYIPSGLLTLFPNLGTLNVENCGTTTLTTDAIPKCGILWSFVLRGGTFTNIPAGVLQSCENLTDLWIVESSATTIDVDALRGLVKLSSIYILSNKISCLPVGLFQHTPKIGKLRFMNNTITAIDSNFFANVPSLRNIDFKLNLITYLPVFNLTGTTQISLIDFQSNPINALGPNFCSIFGTSALTININNISCIPSSSQISLVASSVCQNYALELKNCESNWVPAMSAPVPCAVQSLTTLAPTTPPPTPGSCPSDKVCRYFLDQYNRYTCILDGVDSVLTSISGNHLITFSEADVRRVVFTNSILSRIPKILSQMFPNLEHLTVSNCSITAINTNTFTACGNLKYFDASDNLITIVDGASFKSCAALEVIDLTGNKLAIIDRQLFDNNPTLKTVYINRPAGMVLT